MTTLVQGLKCNELEEQGWNIIGPKNKNFGGSIVAESPDGKSYLIHSDGSVEEKK